MAELALFTKTSESEHFTMKEYIRLFHFLAQEKNYLEWILTDF